MCSRGAFPTRTHQSRAHTPHHLLQPLRSHSGPVFPGPHHPRARNQTPRQTDWPVLNLFTRPHHSFPRKPRWRLLPRLSRCPLLLPPMRPLLPGTIPNRLSCQWQSAPHLLALPHLNYNKINIIKQASGELGGWAQTELIDLGGGGETYCLHRCELQPGQGPPAGATRAGELAWWGHGLPPGTRKPGPP